jgi:hypothetical protein
MSKNIWNLNKNKLRLGGKWGQEEKGRVKIVKGELYPNRCDWQAAPRKF